MADQDWIAGQKAVVEMEFRVKGVPTDPAIVTCTWRTPDGRVSSLNYPSESLLRVGIGQYEAHVLLDVPGPWSFRQEGSGDVDAIDERTVHVHASRVL